MTSLNVSVSGARLLTSMEEFCVAYCNVLAEEVGKLTKKSWLLFIEGLGGSGVVSQYICTCGENKTKMLCLNMQPGSRLSLWQSVNS